MDTRKILMIAIAVSLTFVQEQLLIFLPNFSFTVLLMFVFASVFSFKESMIYIGIYVLLDSMYMGAMNMFYMIPMLIGWSMIPLFYRLFLYRLKDEVYLAVAAFFFGFLYGWIFIPFNMIQFGIAKFWPYLLADLSFEIILAVTGFFTVLLLFKPLKQVLDNILKQQSTLQDKAYK